MIIVGTVDNDFGIIRLNADGTLDRGLRHCRESDSKFRQQRWCFCGSA
jgi:hypothetical protein